MSKWVLAGAVLADLEVVGDAEGDDGVGLQRVEVAFVLVDLGLKVGLDTLIRGHLHTVLALGVANLAGIEHDVERGGTDESRSDFKWEGQMVAPARNHVAPASGS